MNHPILRHLLLHQFNWSSNRHHERCHHKKEKEKQGRRCGPFPDERTEKNTLSQKIIRLRGFAPDFVGSKAVFQINTFIVVELYILGYNLLNLSARGESRPVQAFRFQGSEEIFHCGIVVRT